MIDYLSKYIKYKNKYIQNKFNLLIGSTKYSKQYKLEEEGEIPELKFNEVDIRNNIIISMQIPKNFSLFWTDDNEKSIEKYYNPNKKNCNDVDFKDISDEEYSKNNYLFNCFKYRRGYKIIFNTWENLDNFLKSIVSIVETPQFEETKPYPFIYYVKILGKDFNSFNVFFSYHLQYKIFNSIILWCDNLLKKYKKESYYFIENQADTTYPYTQIISKCEPTDPYDEIIDNTDIKLQMCIKDEYLFWVIENLSKNLDELRLYGLNSFKFFTPSNYKHKKSANYFPNHENNERIDSYFINCKEYKRELLTSPNIVFYLSAYIDPQNINKLINKLKSLFPDNLDITNGFPRFNIRLTKNIFFSVGGDNNPKFSLRSVDKDNIPLEYKYILDIYDKVDINECKKLNDYSKNLTDHDILILNDGKYIPNNITSYYYIIKTYSSRDFFKSLSTSCSFKDLFDRYGLEEFYVCPPIINYKL
jgi:hypothetical protein